MTARMHVLRVPAGIPASALRVLQVLVGGLAVLLVNPSPIWQWVGVTAVLVGAVLPRTLATWAGAACIVIVVLIEDPAPLRTALALLAIHLVHVLGCLGLTIPASAWIRPGALLPTLGRFLLVQALAQPLALLVVLLPSVGESGVAWLAPAGALIAVGLAVAVLRVQRREDADEAGTTR